MAMFNMFMWQTRGILDTMLHEINCVNRARYLGILLHVQLNWKFPINSLCNNLAKIVSAFNLIKTSSFPI